MPKFRKKPVVIEAEEWMPGRDIVGVVPKNPPGPRGSGEYVIETLEGPLHVSPGDWIITGMRGERYPCKPDIFAATYEPLDDAGPAPTPWPGAAPNKANPEVPYGFQDSKP